MQPSFDLAKVFEESNIYNEAKFQSSFLLYLSALIELALRDQ